MIQGSQGAHIGIGAVDGASSTSRSEAANIFGGSTSSGAAKVPHGQSGLSKSAGTSAESLGLQPARGFFELKGELQSLPVPSGANKSAFTGILSKSETEHLTPTIKTFIEGLSNQEASEFAGAEINVLVEKFPLAFTEISPDTLGIFAKSPDITDATIVKILDKVSEHFKGDTADNPEEALNNHFQQLLAAASGGRSGTESTLTSIATSNLPRADDNPQINKKKVKSAFIAVSFNTEYSQHY